MSATRRDALLAELATRRDAFRSALADVPPQLLTVPGLLDAWSARDLVAHVAFWTDHGAAALALAAAGRGAAFDYDRSRTDAMNAEVFAAAAGVSPREASDREAAAYERLQSALEDLDPALLDAELGNGDSVEQVIRYDGPDHYAEHTTHLRAWFGAEGSGGAEGDEGLEDPA